MKTNQSNQDEVRYFFHFSIEIGEREFSVLADTSGTIHFEDFMAIKAKVAAEQVPTENTVLLKFPESFRPKMAEADRVFEEHEHKIVPEVKEQERAMDALLIPFFWEHVNPRLLNPIEREEAA